MMCIGCGHKQQGYGRCRKCHTADNLNTEYLKAEKNGDYERCREITIELLKLEADEK